MKQRRAWKTWAGYRSIVKLHVVPYIGHRRLDGNRNRLEPEHIDTMYAALKNRGDLSVSYIHSVHRMLKASLRAAMKRGKTGRNVCDMVDPPTAGDVEIRAHTLEEAQAIIRSAAQDPLAARWFIGMMLGLRQGEVLGLRWHRLFLAAKDPSLRVEKQLQRQTWVHGCANPVACAAPRCRTKKCPPRYRHGCVDESVCKKVVHHCPSRVLRPGECSRHQRPCPPLCPPGCTDHARGCAQKKDGGLREIDPKSKKSKRGAALPPQLVDALIAHREAQIRACDERKVRWDPEGLVFVQPSGGPIDPRRDHTAWEELLVRAGLPDSRLHTARHDAGTLALATGTDIRVVQEMLGHTRITTTQVYVDVAQDLKQQAVNRVAAALFDGGLAAILQQSAATVDHRSPGAG